MSNWYKREPYERTDAERAASQKAAEEALALSRPLGRVALKYFVSRRIWRPEYLSELSWNNSPYHGIVAKIRKKPGGPIIGVQVTALTPDGQKVARRNLGDLEGGAIWLGEGDPPFHDKPGCVIGEGLETVLSALTLFGKTQGLACMSWSNVIRAPLLRHWEAVVIAADHDEYGKKAAEGLRKRAEKKKARKVITREPSMEGQDWNDVLCQSTL